MQLTGGLIECQLVPTADLSSNTNSFPSQANGNFKIYTGYMIRYPDAPDSCAHKEILSVGECIPISNAKSTFIYYVVTPTAKSLGYFKIMEYSDGFCGTMARVWKDLVFVGICGQTYSPSLPALPTSSVALM